MRKQCTQLQRVIHRAPSIESVPSRPMLRSRRVRAVHNASPVSRPSTVRRGRSPAGMADQVGVVVFILSDGRRGNLSNVRGVRPIVVGRSERYGLNLACPAPRPHPVVRPGAILWKTGSLADGARRRVTASPFRSQRRRLRFRSFCPALLDIVTRVCRGGNRRAPDCGAPDVVIGFTPIPAGRPSPR